MCNLDRSATVGPHPDIAVPVLRKRFDPIDYQTVRSADSLPHLARFQQGQPGCSACPEGSVFEAEQARNIISGQTAAPVDDPVDPPSCDPHNPLQGAGPNCPRPVFPDRIDPILRHRIANQLFAGPVPEKAPVRGDPQGMSTIFVEVDNKHVPVGIGLSEIDALEASVGGREAEEAGRRSAPEGRLCGRG